MKQICELNDKIILGQEGLSTKAPRLTARAIVRNQVGLYAVMYADKWGLHSLSGGGIEEGEDVLTALRREVYEETGCICDETGNWALLQKTARAWTTPRSTTTLWSQLPTSPVRTI